VAILHSNSDTYTQNAVWMWHKKEEEWTAHRVTPLCYAFWDRTDSVLCSIPIFLKKTCQQHFLWRTWSCLVNWGSMKHVRQSSYMEFYGGFSFQTKMSPLWSRCGWCMVARACAKNLTSFSKFWFYSNNSSNNQDKENVTCEGCLKKVFRFYRPNFIKIGPLV